jgi:hypothetical protein
MVISSGRTGSLADLLAGSRTYTPRMSETPEEVPEFVCPYCQAVFAEEQALIAHFCPMAPQH